MTFDPGMDHSYQIMNFLNIGVPMDEQHKTDQNTQT